MRSMLRRRTDRLTDVISDGLSINLFLQPFDTFIVWRMSALLSPESELNMERQYSVSMHHISGTNSLFAAAFLQI